MPSLRPHNAVPCSSLDSYRRFLPPCPPPHPIPKRKCLSNFIRYNLLIFLICIVGAITASPFIISLHLSYSENNATWTQLFLLNNFAQFEIPQFLMDVLACHLCLPSQGLFPKFRMWYVTYCTVHKWTRTWTVHFSRGGSVRRWTVHFIRYAHLDSQKKGQLSS